MTPQAMPIEVRIVRRPWWKVVPRLPKLWYSHYALMRKGGVPAIAAGYYALRLCGVGLQIGKRPVWP
jgi:hypothetical protein